METASNTLPALEISSRTTSKSEDVEPTTKKEIWSWYAVDGTYVYLLLMYSRRVNVKSFPPTITTITTITTNHITSHDQKLYTVANSVYANIGRVLCFPLLLLELATVEGCNQLDYGCDTDGNAINSNERVTIDFLGISLRPASFVFWISSLSGICQFITYIVVGPIADYKNYRKLFLDISSIVGGILTGLFIFYWDPSAYWIAGITVIIGNVLFGINNIVYFAYLPLLIDAHWLVIDKISKLANSSSGGYNNNNNRDENEVNTLREQLQSSISQRGFAAGYVASFTCLIIGAIIFTFNPSENFEIVDKKYGTYSKDNTFNELWAQYVNQINVWYINTTQYGSGSGSDDDMENNSKQQLLGIQFEYDNGAIGNSYGTTEETETDIDIDIDIINSSFKSNGNNFIESINLWDLLANLDGDNNGNVSSIGAIQLELNNGDSSPIYGSTTYQVECV